MVRRAPLPRSLLIYLRWGIKSSNLQYGVAESEYEMQNFTSQTLTLCASVC